MSDKNPYPTALDHYVPMSHIDYALAILPGGHSQKIGGHVPKGTIEIIVKYKGSGRTSQRRIPIHTLTRKGLTMS